MRDRFAQGAREADRLARQVAAVVKKDGDVEAAVAAAFEQLETFLPEPVTAGAASVHRLPKNLLDSLRTDTQSTSTEEAT